MALLLDVFLEQRFDPFDGVIGTSAAAAQRLSLRCVAHAHNRKRPALCIDHVLHSRKK
jgi:predicted patatin/cPLA2 family phospholipase